MLSREQIKRGLTDRAVAAELGVLQQTYSSWKAGSVPRPGKYAPLAAFLGITDDMVMELCREARQSTGNTRLPKMSSFSHVRQYGVVSDRKDGRYRFREYNAGRKRVPEGRYSIAVDTKVMEPALPVGTKAWLDPGVWPKPGHEVLVHAKGTAWLGRLSSIEGSSATIERNTGPVTIDDVEAVHVVVLSERI